MEIDRTANPTIAYHGVPDRAQLRRSEVIGHTVAVQLPKRSQRQLEATQLSGQSAVPSPVILLRMANVVEDQFVDGPLAVAVGEMAPTGQPLGYQPVIFGLA